MQRYKCIVVYDGFDYIGFQSQVHGNTIQQAIEKALSDITLREIKIVASGRTDAKVHAEGQCFHFDTDFELSLAKWKMALNGHLPDDIHIISVEKVSKEFHARFSAKGKKYKYCINLGEYDALRQRYEYQATWSIDVEKMIECSKLFIGTHDFSSFCANSFETHPNQVRTISSIEFDRKDDHLTITFVGNGFLRYMVRMLVGTMLEVGRGKIDVEEVKKIKEARNKGACRYNAKPYGLTLVEVFYN